MGNRLAKSIGASVTEGVIKGVAEPLISNSDQSSVVHHVHNGGCLQEFLVATGECHPREVKRRDGGVVVDAEACVVATAALRKCFGRNRRWFEHQYIARMDRGLDEDLKPSPERVEEESEYRFRWWTGMRRSRQAKLN